MRTRCLCLSLVLAVGIWIVALLPPLPHAALAVEYTFTTIDVPGAIRTSVYGINDAGTIVGSFWDASGVAHGFVYDGTTLTQLDVPGASFTLALGINDTGSIVGEYYHETGSYSHGFVYNGMIITTVDVPGDFRTMAQAINDADLIVGYFIQGISGTVGARGFVYDGATFSPFEVPGTVNNTVPMGINDAGLIVGYSSALTMSGSGFVYDGATFSSFVVPGGIFTQAHGINDSGTIVGRYNSLLIDNVRIRGFVYDGTTFTPLDVPGSFNTVASGINDSGTIVGYYNDGQHGFVAIPLGKAVSIDIRPGDGPNPINPKSKGRIPVAILAAEDFPVPDLVEASALTFGRTGNEKSLAYCNPNGEDVNGDGYDDLVCHFYTQIAGFECGSQEGILMGKTTDGSLLEGRDTINVLPCKR